jgi:hypothetical protein
MLLTGYDEPTDENEVQEAEPWWAAPRPWFDRHDDDECPYELRDGWTLVYDDIDAAAPVAA